jgi:hypothetical protein
MNDIVRRSGTGQWLPGQSGNAQGRPPGVRQRFGESLYRQADAEIAKRGQEGWDWLWENHRLEWMRLMVQLRPREMELKVEQTSALPPELAALSPEQKKAAAAFILAGSRMTGPRRPRW